MKESLASEFGNGEADPAEPMSINRLGHFELIEKIGQGGMGVVYKARDLNLGRLVALKMIRPEFQSEPDPARFRIEAESVARLQHPNIVQIYEICEVGGQTFLSLEFVEGGAWRS